MNIPQPLAQNIVTTIKDALSQEVNFMNTDGLIIASTDNERINTIHEGALVVIKTKEPLLIKEDHRYKGTRKGINLPIHFDHKVIGVIGLSGESHVQHYAKILKTMTEIMIKEAYLNEVSFQKREKNRLIIDSLFLNATDELDNSLFGLDFTQQFRIILGNFSSDDFPKRENLFQLIEFILSPHPQILFTLNHQSIILIVPETKQIDLPTLLTTIQQKAFEQQKITLNFGIGLTGKSPDELRKSLSTAKQALNWLQSQRKVKEMTYFEELDLGILLEGISFENKTLFIQQVLGDVPEKEIENFKMILEVFSKHSGSIQKSADELFIHKNTFQYQLNKLKKLTGYDPRNYHDFTLLYLAFLLIN